MLNSEDIVLTFSFCALVLVGLVGNLLVCLVVYLNRSMQTPMNYLLVNLAMADMVAVTFISPQYVFIHVFTHPTGVTGDIICKFITGGNLSWIGGVASVFSLVAISFERHQAVTNPYNAVSKFSALKVKIIVISCWIFTIAFNFPLFFAIYYDEENMFCLEAWPSPGYGKANSTAWLVIVGILPATIMISLYARVIYDLWFKKINGNVQIAVRKSRRKVTKLVLIVSVIYAVSWFPQLILYPLSHYHHAYEFGGIPYITTVVMVTFNSAINPVIYGFQSERFREYFKQFLFCQRRKASLVTPLVANAPRPIGESLVTANHAVKETSRPTPSTNM
ncbi:allatostatin-A receptor-like [Stylophora pistillata]|uniref:allatostatin-A receptor-like n=1 Tax=Stylophora pistillata TaxID=50429 RepID=UPI000C0575F0|nr:allatostatin-A receptor-like [Stylophora pistillata]